MPVPHTDTGRQVEETKVDERIPVKELGTNDPVTSGKGVLAMVKPARVELKRVAAKRPRRLFNKNTGRCERETADVYRLTPAQCWKVKGSCASGEPKPQ